MKEAGGPAEFFMAPFKTSLFFKGKTCDAGTRRGQPEKPTCHTDQRKPDFSKQCIRGV